MAKRMTTVIGARQMAVRVPPNRSTTRNLLTVSLRIATPGWVGCPTVTSVANGQDV